MTTAAACVVCHRSAVQRSVQVNNKVRFSSIHLKSIHVTQFYRGVGVFIYAFEHNRNEIIKS